MLPETVIDREVARNPAVALAGVLERHPVGSSSAEGLDKPLRFAVDAGHVGSGADVFEALDLQALVTRRETRVGRYPTSFAGTRCPGR